MARSTKSIDNLEIKITANAQNANQALENLTKNITNLGNALNGIDTKTFTDGIKGIGQAVKGVNLTNFQKQMTKMSKAMSSYASNMAKVARNTRSGTSGFNSFARGVDGMYSGLSRINNKINEFGARMKKANRETKNFAQTVGLLYARFFLLIRGAKGLIGAVKSSMNYIEVLNYFDSSFGQVAERGVEKWSEMGYESAQAYYDSFSDRAKKVTADMSGFFPEENGTLTKTSMASLGMNPQQLMQYQAQFAQMSSSMGTTSEQALILSEVLTKLGADLASVKNMEFEDVWKDMASGLVGMSRTLDKYGANIRNANMDMKLHELGIDANVKSLSQADKALLRTIILLDASKYAWTDLATTLDTPANQFRMLSNNVKLLGQMIGNLLLPVVAKILPYINAFVIALQRLFMWLGKVLGIDLSNLTAKKKSGGDNSPISDILDDAEDLSGALDDDADSAKKLKKQLQGFDALNNLTTNEDKTKGLDSKLASGLLNDAFLDAVDDYLKAWQDAFDQLENKAEKIADKIQKFFLDLIYPIRKAWQAVGKDVVDAWKKAFKSIKNLFKDIGRDFMKMWHEKETIRVFKNIFTVVKDIGLVISIVADKFREAWNNNDTGLHILEHIRDIFLIITEHIKNMADATVEWAKNLDFTPLLSKIDEFLVSIQPVAEAVWGTIEDFYKKVLLPLGEWVLEDGLPDLLQVFIDFNNKIDWDKLRERLAKLWEHLEPFAETVGEGLIKFVERITTAIADFVNSERFEKFLEKIENWMDNVSPDDVADGFEKIAKAIISIKVALALLAGIKALSTTVTSIASLFAIFGVGSAGAVATELGATATSLGVLSGALGTLATAIGGVVAVAGTWSIVDSKFFDLLDHMTKQADVVDRMREKYEGFKGFFEIFKDAGKIVSGQAFVQGGIEGITSTAQSLADAMEKVNVGFVYTEAELQELAERFNWSEEDIDTYKQHVVDATEAQKKLNAHVSETQKIHGNGGGHSRGNGWIDEQIKKFHEYATRSDMSLYSIEHRTEKHGNILSGLFTKSFDDKWDENKKKLENLGFNSVGSISNGMTSNTSSLTTATLNVGEAGVAEYHKIEDKYYDAGRESVIKYATGIESNSAEITTKTGAISGQLERTFGTLNSKMQTNGANMMTGFANGIQSNSPSALSKITNFVANMSKVFTSVQGAMRTNGSNLMIGLANGIMSQVSSVLSRVRSIASSIVNTFSRTWRIHSPSLIMDDMGINLMKGLQNGIESMYAPIEQSIGQFGMEVAKAPEIAQIGELADVGSISANQTFNTDNSETNALLRAQNSILQAILAKETGIRASDIFDSVMSSADSYERQTGRKAFA